MKTLKIPAVRNLLLISFFFTLANCLMFQWYAYFSPVELLTKSAFVFVINLLFWTSCSFSSKFFKVLASFFVIGSLVLFYFYMAFGVSPYINTIDLLMQTDASEVMELLVPSMLIPLMASVVIAYIIFKAECKSKGYVSLIALFLLITITAANLLMDKFFDKRAITGTHMASVEKAFANLPFNFVLDIIFEVKKKIKINKYYNIASKYPFHWKTPEKDLLVVLVLGESARYDKFHINGYDQATSPYLDRNPQVISLHDYYALETTTRKALPYIYKRSNNSQFTDSRESSFVPAFKALGFKTYYLSLQSDLIEDFYRFVVEYDYYALGIKTRKLGRSNRFYDEILLNEAEHIIKQKGRRLLVLHTMGSHFDYSQRVPQDQVSKHLNDYDNSIKYTDYFLNKLFTRVDDIPAVVFYTSDHGESLEGDKTRLHAYPIELALRDAPEQVHIPGFWFFSKKYLENKDHQEKFSAIQKRAHERLDQSYVFHSLLACIGVTSPAIDANKNLCSVRGSKT